MGNMFTLGEIMAVLHCGCQTRNVVTLPVLWHSAVLAMYSPA
jgi:hypothetical protein